MVDQANRLLLGRVTVVIPSKQEGGWIRTTVQNVLQAHDELLAEIVVVDDGSTDGSCAGLEELGNEIPVRVKRTEGVGAARARNLGAADAIGEFLVFVDAHSRPEPGWLREICDVLQMGHAGAVPWVNWFEPENENVATVKVMGRWFLAGSPGYQMGAWPAEKGDAVPMGVGGCQAFQRVAFDAIEGYCEDLPFGGEDSEICLRMWSRGGTLGAAPGATIWTLQKAWEERPDKDEIEKTVRVGVVKAVVLHWSAHRLAAMWALLAKEWSEWPTIFSMVWEGCHEPGAMELRQRYRSEAVRSDDEIFALFPELS